MDRKYADGESPEEVEVLRSQLVECLIRLGTVAPDWFEERMKDCGARDQTEWRWGVSEELIYEHLASHSSQISVHCSRAPCLIECASLALWEVCEFRAQLLSAPVLTRDALLQLSATLRSGGAETRAVIRLESERILAKLEEWRVLINPAVFNSASLDIWKQCSQLVDSLDKLADHAQQLSAQIDNSTMSRPLANRRVTGKGRRAGALIPAVWQHLRAGGMSQKDIAEQVPGLSPDKSVSRIVSRIASRLQEADEYRSVFPQDPAQSPISEK